MDMIGGKIKIIRELKNLTQEYMAEKLEMSQANYSRLEKNEVELSVPKAQKIADILEVKLSDILDFNEKNVLNNCNVEVFNSGFATINYQISPEIKKLYEDTIKLLEEKIALLEKK
jgi:transcriptional regulator with XRE-family HTH domain